jgi:hypothetical protein
MKAVSPAPTLPAARPRGASRDFAKIAYACQKIFVTGKCANEANEDENLALRSL